MVYTHLLEGKVKNMQNSDVQKFFKLLSPLSCPETRQLFPEFLQDETSSEQREQIQEHLVVCEECIFALTNAVEEQVDSGVIPMRKFPSELPLPTLEAFFSVDVYSRKKQGAELEREEEAQLQDFQSSALEAIDHMAKRAAIHPDQIKQRLFKVGTIFAIGLIGTVVSLLAIGLGLPQSEPVRLLTVFVLVGCLMLTFAAGLAFMLITWSAFVYQYARAERGRENAGIVLGAAVALGQDQDFDREVVDLVIEKIQSASPNAARLTVAQAPMSVATSDLVVKGIGPRLSLLLYKHLARKKEVSRVVEEEENFQDGKAYV